MSKITIPRYGTKGVTEIIEDDTLDLETKADRIYRYDEYWMERNRKGAVRRKPIYSKSEIKNALIELMR